MQKAEHVDMKTPKRHYELTAVSHDPCERVWDRPQEEVSAQRWKRKNRIKQLKNTIARMKEENARLWDGFSRMSVSFCDLYNTYIFDHPGETPVHLTPGELLECCHALKQQTRFNTTEQRANAESAVHKLKTAYGISTIEQP